MRTHPTSGTYPYTIRLFVDIDPAGNPIGMGCVSFEDGRETSTIWFHPPGPFDTLTEAWTELCLDYSEEIGQQSTLF